MINRMVQWLCVSLILCILLIDQVKLTKKSKNVK